MSKIIVRTNKNWSSSVAIYSLPEKKWNEIQEKYGDDEEELNDEVEAVVNMYGPRRNRQSFLVMAMELEGATFCCGFPEVGAFSCDVRKKLPPGEVAEQAKAIVHAELPKLYKQRYYRGYVPDLKTAPNDRFRQVLTELGFVPGVSLPSQHGKYTNTEYILDIR